MPFRDKFASIANVHVRGSFAVFRFMCSQTLPHTGATLAQARRQSTTSARRNWDSNQAETLLQAAIGQRFLPQVHYGGNNNINSNHNNNYHHNYSNSNKNNYHYSSYSYYCPSFIRFILLLFLFVLLLLLHTSTTRHRVYRTPKF